MHKIILFGMFCYFSVFATLFGTDSENAKEEIKNRMKEISETVKQHQWDALQSFWTQDARWTNPVTGETHKGNKDIAGYLQKRTQDIEKRQLHLAITPGDITFPAPNKAIVEATVDVKDSKEQVIQRFERKITLINQDGKWYVNEVREVEESPLPSV